jgi:hypothetical protein
LQNGTAFGFIPLGALGSRALSSSTDKLPGGFGLGRKNRNEAFAINVDEGVQESVEVTHETPFMSSLQEAAWMCCEGHA